MDLLPEPARSRRYPPAAVRKQMSAVDIARRWVDGLHHSSLPNAHRARTHRRPHALQSARPKPPRKEAVSRVGHGLVACSVGVTCAVTRVVSQMVNATGLLLTLLLNVIFFTGLVVQLPDAREKLILPPMA
jgi:hypothetical protein